MNDKIAQRFGTPSIPRYAHKTSSHLQAKRAVEESHQHEFSELKSLLDNQFIESALRAKRQNTNEFPYKIIYLNPQQHVQSSVYSAPKLEQIQAIYPYSLTNCPNNISSSIPQNIYPNAIPKSNPSPAIIYPNNIQSAPSVCPPQTASKPIACQNSPAIRPVYVQNPIYTRYSPNGIPPKIYNCPIITASPPTVNTIKPTVIAPPSTIATNPGIITTVSPLTTQIPMITTTDAPEPLTTTIAAPPMTTPCNCSSETTDGKKKRCGFCINKAYFFFGSNSKSIAALANLLKKNGNDDDSDVFQMGEIHENETNSHAPSNPTTPCVCNGDDDDYKDDDGDENTNTNGNNDADAMYVDVDEPKRDGKPIFIHEAEPIAAEENQLPGADADRIHSDCRTSLDLIEACKDLSKTITSFDSENI